MVSARMRPRFEVVVPCTPPQALERLSKHLEDPDGPCRGSILGRHVHLEICEARRRYWSPQLNVDVEGHPDGALLRGLFGPHPDVWTLFVALYAILGFCGLVGLIFGLSQWSLGTAPLALWAVPAAAGLAALVYGVALTGQRLGREQMIVLRSFLDGSVSEG